METEEIWWIFEHFVNGERVQQRMRRESARNLFMKVRSRGEKAWIYKEKLYD